MFYVYNVLLFLAVASCANQKTFCKSSLVPSMFRLQQIASDNGSKNIQKTLKNSEPDTPSVKGEINNVNVTSGEVRKRFKTDTLSDYFSTGALWESNRLVKEYTQDKLNNTKRIVSSPLNDPCRVRVPHPLPKFDPCHKIFLQNWPVNDTTLKKEIQKHQNKILNVTYASMKTWAKEFDEKVKQDFERILGPTFFQENWYISCKGCLSNCSSCLWCNSTRTCIDAIVTIDSDNIACEYPSSTCTGRRF